mmetsp:Transcript_1838/g.2915  ORF Transcript_1838/g.2915 Transcript_1838/m.2915 type:complete len:508 (-) Transcript_1838:268-1791(-)|eukprot:CAMPEP_0185025470 /NCGR_PEP_ID=MMETSP1103-20130426/8412_1 /TAXON_ID=36769 /ORGANISM="Paraphysomonas bandaiensis, Strain Caron Lab Isolate" /LENGTH=507 /DNA_ID=CAMNT_0027558673 /DNA_START=41 /DNA_END=1564 /DNA_ORIENTATION=+
MGCSNGKSEVPELPEPPRLPGTQKDLDVLRESVSCLYFPQSNEYDTARRTGTWMLDPISFGRPSAIASVKSAEEILAVVKFSIATGVRIVAACGRHTHESIVQESLCVDLSTHMDFVEADTVTKQVRVGGGATIGKVDSACASFNFIIPLGRVPSTGCAGQMLITGAHGFCERAYGLGVDYMVSAVVVVARNGGEILFCSANENPDLFWAIKGGGPHYGIVSEMTFSVVEAPNNGQFAAGQRVYIPTGILGMPTRQKVMSYVLSNMFNITSPSEYSCSTVFLGGAKSNPCIVVEFWFGANPGEGEAYFKQYDQRKQIGVAVADTHGVHDYWTTLQRWTNGPKGEDVGPGAYYYRGVMTSKITPEMGTAIVTAVDRKVPTGVQPVVLLDMMGGGKSQDPDVTAQCALPTRPNYWIIIICQWQPEVTGAKGRDISVAWVRELWKTLIEYSAAHETVQLDKHANIDELLKDTLELGQQAKVSRVYGDNTERIRSVKEYYDPDGIFGTITF